jgi:GDSL-like Lipase/Acylhydrolase family
LILLAIATQWLAMTAGAQPTAQDRVIVSIGDSYASGEGNPNVPYGTFLAPGSGIECVTTSSSPPAQWTDAGCHRSEKNGPTFFAQLLKNAFPASATSFQSFACSGATIESGLLGNQNLSYATVLGTTTVFDAREPQVDAVARFACAKNPAGSPDCGVGVVQPIDVLIISVGGNDAGLADMIRNCLVNDKPPTSLDPSNPECPYGDFGSQLPGNLAGLPGKYDALAQAIKSKLGPAVKAVWLTEYPDPTRYSEQGYCSLFNDATIFPGVTIKLTPGEASRVRRYFIQPLQLIMRDAAARNGWTYVAGIAADSVGHGACANADTRWFRTEGDAYCQEGANVMGATWYGFDGISSGFLHPNENGHHAYAGWMYQALAGGLTVAAYDPALGVPACGAVGASCSSGSLLVGRGSVGPEPHAPNNGSPCGIPNPIPQMFCTAGEGIDGGTFHVDESLDAIRVETANGALLSPGQLVKVTVDVWASGQFASSDYLDLWVGGDIIGPPYSVPDYLASYPVAESKWHFIGTYQPAGGGPQQITALTVLPAGKLQAIRGRFRRISGPDLGSLASFSDVDVLVFPASPAPGIGWDGIMSVVGPLILQ